MAPKWKSLQKADSASGSTTGSPADQVWRHTKVMNMHDLARDDDYLSHIFVEKLGTTTTPLMVHKMDPLRRLPKTDTAEVLAIVHRLIHVRPTGPVAVKQAVSELLTLPAVAYFMRDYEQHQINAFATHASRYLELYLPTGSIEIAQTSRYSKWTGKNELCILATRPLAAGTVISELKGSMADLTDEEDKELKRTGARDDGGVRRDFSVIHSKQMKKNHLFLGPARFVNHDCDHNCELFRTGRYITFRVIKPIGVGQEVTAHYGDGYFGRNNRHCLCETCERLGRGGYGPQLEVEESPSESESSLNSDSDTSTSDSDLDDDLQEKPKINVNQRSTRQGVYLTLPDSDGEQGEHEGETREKVRDTDTTSDLTPAPSSSASVIVVKPEVIDLTEILPPPPQAPHPEREPDAGDPILPQSPVHCMSRSLSTLSSVTTSPGTSSTPKSSFKSVITTRSQKAKSLSAAPVETPVPDVEAGSNGSGFDGPTESLTVVVSVSAPPGGTTDTPTDPPRRKRGRPRKYPLPEPGQEPVKRYPPKKVKTVRVKPAEDPDPEPRVLRARPSLPSLPAKKADTAKVVPAVVEKAAVMEEPKGPTCMTCASELPPPPNEQESASPRRSSRGGKGKGKEKEVREDCPRCKRHLFIYGVPWPQRNPSPGTHLFATPREETPSAPLHKVTHKDLPLIDRKLQAVKSHKRKREASEETQPKRRKTELRAESPQPRGQVVRRTYGSKNLLSRSGRAHMPSMKAREFDSPPVREAGDGSPADVIEAVQPRDANGRFGKKLSTNGRFRRAITAGSARMSRAQRSLKGRPGRPPKRARTASPASAIPRTDETPACTPVQPEQSTARTPAKRGRPRKIPLVVEDVSRDAKRLRQEEQSVVIDDRRDKTFWPAPPPVPPLGLGFKRSGLLNMRPNPTHVSRWRSNTLRRAHSSESTPMLLDDSTDEDVKSDEQPATPEDENNTEHAVEVRSSGSTPDRGLRISPSDGRVSAVQVTGIDDSDDDQPALVPRRASRPPLKGLGLGLKPNPITLSKRIWSSEPMQADSEKDEYAEASRDTRQHDGSPHAFARSSLSCEPIAADKQGGLSRDTYDTESEDEIVVVNTSRSGTKVTDLPKTCQASSDASDDDITCGENLRRGPTGTSTTDGKTNRTASPPIIRDLVTESSDSHRFTLQPADDRPPQSNPTLHKAVANLLRASEHIVPSIAKGFASLLTKKDVDNPRVVPLLLATEHGVAVGFDLPTRVPASLVEAGWDSSEDF